jgi:hypothetical protein
VLHFTILKQLLLELLSDVMRAAIFSRQKSAAVRRSDLDGQLGGV